MAGHQTPILHCEAELQRSLCLGLARDKGNCVSAAMTYSLRLEREILMGSEMEFVQIGKSLVCLAL